MLQPGNFKNQVKDTMKGSVMNTWSFKLYQIVAAAILLQLCATGAMAGDKAKEMDWAALNPKISGATSVKGSGECVECHDVGRRQHWRHQSPASDMHGNTKIDLVCVDGLPVESAVDWRVGSGTCNGVKQ